MALQNKGISVRAHDLTDT